MQAIVIIRLSDMRPVLECFDHECFDLVLKPEYYSMTTTQWLKTFNNAVTLNNGYQPSADQIRAQIQGTR